VVALDVNGSGEAASKAAAGGAAVAAVAAAVGTPLADVASMAAVASEMCAVDPDVVQKDSCEEEDRRDNLTVAVQTNDRIGVDAAEVDAAVAAADDAAVVAVVVVAVAGAVVVVAAAGGGGDVVVVVAAAVAAAVRMALVTAMFRRMVALVMLHRMVASVAVVLHGMVAVVASVAEDVATVRVARWLPPSSLDASLDMCCCNGEGAVVVGTGTEADVVAPKWDRALAPPPKQDGGVDGLQPERSCVGIASEQWICLVERERVCACGRELGEGEQICVKGEWRLFLASKNKKTTTMGEILRRQPTNTHTFTSPLLPLQSTHPDGIGYPPTITQASRACSF